MPFPRELALYEMQTAPSRFWTRITVFISYNNSHYSSNWSVHLKIGLLYTQMCCTDFRQIIKVKHHCAKLVLNGWQTSYSSYREKPKAFVAGEAMFNK